MSSTYLCHFFLASESDIIVELRDDLKNSPFNPHAVPEDLAPRIRRLHGEPLAWWVGQMVKYLIRPQKTITQKLKKIKRDTHFVHPIVGYVLRYELRTLLNLLFCFGTRIHIPMKYKNGPPYGKKYDLHQYMKSVSAYFDQMELTKPVPKRRIYLSSPNATIFETIKVDYPNYEVLGKFDQSLFGIIKDICFLGKSSHIIGPFSSSVIRKGH